MMSAVKLLAKTVLFIAGVLVCAEIGLRLFDRFVPAPDIGNADGSPLQARAMRAFLAASIFRQWAEYDLAGRPHPFRPPFPVFVNKDFLNDERLRKIARLGPLPPGGRWTVPDFLRRPGVGAASDFTVTTNRFGFRDPDRSLEKKPGVFRIVALGSYPTFGHAVDDDRTYPRLLEKRLNARARRGFSFEVWNGGRQGASAISGLARLKNETPRQKPDLVILDYGWVEPFLQADMVRREGEVKTASGRPAWLLHLLKPCKDSEGLREIRLCRSVYHWLTRFGLPDAIRDFRDVTAESLRVARENRWPVVLVKESGVLIPTDAYASLARPDDGVFFADLSALTRKPLPDADIEAFWTKPNWLSEMGVRREDVMKSEPAALYRSNAVQLNGFAYREIAARLEAELVRLTREGKLALPVSL